jgi:integrase
MRTFSDEQLTNFLNQKPKTDNEWRFYAMFCTLADTGIRVTECLTIKTEKVDFDNLLITVRWTPKSRQKRDII